MKKNLTPKQKRFKKLNPKDQLRLIESQLKLYTSAVSGKMSILPSLATMSAALLIIATFNPELIPISTLLLKTILSFLLISVPILFLVFLMDKEGAAQNSLKIIEDHTGQNPTENIPTTLCDKLTAWTPILMILIYFGITIIVLYAMWRG